MKVRLYAFFAFVIFASAAVAQTGPGPVDPLYLTYSEAGGYTNIVVVQGNTVTNFAEAYGAPYEVPIAVYGDIRTTGYENGFSTGGQYALAGTPTGTRYSLPGVISAAYDSTSDGTHNFLVDYNTGDVYETARDYTNAIKLFTPGEYRLGITFDAANDSLWISGSLNGSVTDYSLNGALLTAFYTGHPHIGALALDPGDQTLWLVNDDTGYLQQYSQGGVLLSTGPWVGHTDGGEFNLQEVPESGSVPMLLLSLLVVSGAIWVHARPE
jgi:hypothetical protein